jgi:hypothetical protein
MELVSECGLRRGIKAYKNGYHQFDKDDGSYLLADLHSYFEQMEDLLLSATDCS